MILLSLRNTIHQGLNFTQSEAVFGHHLRLPGTLFSHNKSAETLIQADERFVQEFTDHVQSLPTMPFHNYQRRTQMQNFVDCKHVYIRCDSIKTSLAPAYTGPWLVRKIDDKSIFVQNGLKIDKISIDRCKVANILNLENMEINDSQQDLFFTDNDDEIPEECQPPPMVPVRESDSSQLVEGDLPRIFDDVNQSSNFDVPEIPGNFAPAVIEQLADGPSERYTRCGRNVRLPAYLNDYELEL